MDEYDKFEMPEMDIVRQAGYSSGLRQNELAEKQSHDMEQLITTSIVQNNKIKQLISVMTQQSQEIEKLIELTREQGKGATRQSRRSLYISLIAVLIAAGAITFSFLDFKGDAIWQRQQIDVLKEIRNSIPFGD